MDRSVLQFALNNWKTARQSPVWDHWTQKHFYCVILHKLKESFFSDFMDTRITIHAFLCFHIMSHKHASYRITITGKKSTIVD